MAVLKRCNTRGQCPKSPRCDHPWHIWLNIRRGLAGDKPERGVVGNYMFLLPPGAQVPVNRTEAEDLEALVKAWVLNGRPAIATPTPDQPGITPSSGEHEMTIAAAAKDYGREYLEHEIKWPDREHSIVRDICAFVPRGSGTAMANRSISALCDHRLLRAYLRAVEDRTSASNANHHYARWSHWLNWCVGEYRLVGDRPFRHRSLRPHGIEKPRPDHALDNRRLRLVTDDEDAALIATFKAWPDGGMMLGRYYCALDVLLRQGEMLNLTKAMIKREKVHGATEFVIKVSASVSKTERARELFVETDRLKAFIETRQFSAHPFGQLDGAAFDRFQFRTEWENSLVEAGIYRGEQRDAVDKVRVREWVWTDKGGDNGPLQWRDLRRSGATRLHEHGTPLDAIRAMLGHTSIATTQRYLHITDTSMRAHLRAFAKAHNL